MGAWNISIYVSFSLNYRNIDENNGSWVAITWIVAYNVRQDQNAFSVSIDFKIQVHISWNYKVTFSRRCHHGLIQ